MRYQDKDYQGRQGVDYLDGKDSARLEDILKLVSDSETRIVVRIDRLEDRINGRLTWLERRDWIIGGGVIFIIGTILVVLRAVPI
jgi:hypothetical protein